MSKAKFNKVLEKINVVLKGEGMREYDEDQFLAKLFERYVIFCRSRNIVPNAKNLERFVIKFKAYLCKEPKYLEGFIDAYFTDNLYGLFYDFNQSLVKPKESKEEKEEKSK